MRSLANIQVMATFLSSPQSAGGKATAGERRFAQRLSDLLEDDYLCWYDVPIGSRHQHPDFLILHPARGLLVLEIKDWNLDTIVAADPKTFTIDVGAGHKVVASPLEQARQYAHAVTTLLKHDPQLKNPTGSPYEGQLNFPYGYGVVLTNITRAQFERSGLDAMLLPHLVICKDEMAPSVDAEAFQSRLWSMFNVRFDSKLTLPQVERIRWWLFPELRIRQQSLPIHGTGGVADAPVAPMDKLQVMDLAQEEIARSLGEGHRVIHGVAGSGKTLILAYRCAYLARELQKPILVLVFNRALASWLRHHLEAQGVGDRVTVSTFHGWCMDQLRLYHVAAPPQGNDFVDQLVQTVVRAVDRGQIPREQYGAVMIDEGHDFSPDWLKLSVQMLDPVSNSFLLLYDDAQSIYAANRPKAFSFKSVGISAVGRTKILRRNYRNTDEILACARKFAANLLAPVDADEDGVPLLFPESGGRSGIAPRFAQLPTLRDEAVNVAKEINSLQARGVPLQEIGVFYTAPFVAEEIAMALQAAKLPFDWLRNAASKDFDPHRTSVKLMTPHSSKGLQYRVVIIAGIGFMPYKAETDDARLLYVAMTRATHELVLTSCKPSSFSQRIAALCERKAA